MAKIDDSYQAIISDAEFNKLTSITKDFLKSYSQNSDKPVKEWLIPELAKQLPGKSEAELQKIADEIIDRIAIREEKDESLRQAVSDGRSTEGWLNSEFKKATAGMSADQTTKYFQSLDETIKDANDAFHRTITNKNGTISQNPNLDGYLAEQYHAQTYNLKAAVKESPNRAEVLEPNGKRYGKNSKDVVIRDPITGKIIRSYQLKYGKDAAATKREYKKGNYRGQRKVVPADQCNEIPHSTGKIESSDGITSKPLTKEQAVQLKKKAQSGNWEDLDWNNSYATKDLISGIAKQAGKATANGALVGAGAYAIQKLANGEEIETEEVVESALESGADYGIKCAAAGALKVGVEKEIIKGIPKGVSANVCTNIAFTAVEDVKVMKKVATGELTVEEGMDTLEQNTASTLAGLAAGEQGAAVGAAVGSALGPVGTFVGAAVGGTIASVAGSMVAKTVVKGVQKIKKKAREIISDTIETVSSAVSNIKDTVLGWIPFF